MLLHSLHGGRVPLLVEAHHLPAVGSVGPGAAQFAEPAHERRSRGVVFQASPPAAGARLAVALDGDVAHLHPAVAVAAEKTAADQHAAADAGSDGDEHHVRSPLRGPEQRFAQRHHVGVVAGEGFQPRGLLDTVGKRNVLPPRDVLRSAQHRAAVGRDDSRRADADPGQRQAPARGVFPAGFDAFQNLSQHRFGALLRQGRELTVEKHLPGGGDHGVLHRSAAEVYSDRMAYHRQALSTQIGELQPHWPSRWRTRT